MSKQVHIRRLTLILGMAAAAALLIVLQISPAPALGQTVPDDAEQLVGHTIAEGATRDYSCTAGATGNCTVVYVLPALPSAEYAIELCGSPRCVTRIEYRW